MGDQLIGIDVAAAMVVARRWRATSARWRSVAADTAGRGDELQLHVDAVRRANDVVATGLDRVAGLLEARAAAIDEAFDGIGWTPQAALGPLLAEGDGSDDAAADSLIEWLASGRRGSIVSEVAGPSAAAWAELVATGSRVDGARTLRAFDIAADPGAGVIVVDFFIPDAASFVLQGDDRGHTDPVFGDVELAGSRVVVVLDLESGRGMVQLDDTCVVGGVACNEARPIVLDGAELVASPSRDLIEWVPPGVPPVVTQLEIPNQLAVESVRGRVHVEYDLLNGIVPIGSVDGTFTLVATGGGRYGVERLDTDRYPSIGIYQYRRGRRIDVLARQDSAGVWAAFPVLPSAVDVVADAARDVGGVARGVGDAIREVLPG